MTAESLTPYIVPLITALIAALGTGWWTRRKNDADAVRVYVEGVYGPMIAALTSEIGRAIGRAESLESQLESLRQQLATLRADHDVQLRTRDARIRELEDECDQLRVDLAAAQERERALERRVGELEAKSGAA